MPSSGEQAQPGRILVVEDERIVALDLVTTLRNLGYIVLGSIATGERAVASAVEHRPDVVLMDIRLAGEIDGIQAASEIRQRCDAPIIYLTAHADDDTLRRATATEPSGYLVKPFKAAELRCAIEIALRRREIDGRLRERIAWLATTLEAIGERPAGAISPPVVDNPVTDALTGWQCDEAVGRRLDDIRHLVHEPGTAAPDHAGSNAGARGDDQRRFDAIVQQQVGERTAVLEAANRELEAFSASVAHDLRAPLRHIDGFSQILIEDHAANLGPDGLALLQRVRTATTQMRQLVDDLLRLARVDQAAIDRRAVDVSAMAHAVVETLRATSPGHRPEVTIGENLVVHADSGMLRIVLENLLGNAWKFTARTPRPAIAIGVAHDAAPALFVRDNGAGFDAARATKLFGPFQRFHAAGEFEGSGMGLAIVHRIVKRHGGRIWAASRPGAGATFYLVM